MRQYGSNLTTPPNSPEPELLHAFPCNHEVDHKKKFNVRWVVGFIVSNIVTFVIGAAIGYAHIFQKYRLFPGLLSANVTSSSSTASSTSHLRRVFETLNKVNTSVHIFLYFLPTNPVQALGSFCRFPTSISNPPRICCKYWGFSHFFTFISSVHSV